MSTERPQRHVLDELLAKSAQAPPDEPAWATHPALQGEGLKGDAINGGTSSDAEAQLGRGPLAHIAERLAGVEQRVAGLEERLAMSEESERQALEQRARVVAELGRLRGSFWALTPLVHALHQAMGEIQGALAREPEAGAAHGGGEGGDAGGGGGTEKAPPAAADSHTTRAPGAASGEAGGASPLASTGFAGAEQGAANLLRALVDVVERWRAHGAGA